MRKRAARLYCDVDVRVAVLADGTLARDRFWSYVDRGAADVCWPWLRGPYAKPAHDSYGQFYVGEAQLRAHVAAFVLASGALVPSGAVVRHTCDNARCCNPQHLVLGTVADNNRDRVTRGRSAIGQRSGKAVYTEDQVRALQAAIAQGTSVRGAARLLGFHPSAARSIAIGRTWVHVRLGTRARCADPVR